MANKRLTSDTWSFFCENIARGKRHIDYEIDFQAYKCNLHGKKVKKKKKKASKSGIGKLGFLSICMIKSFVFGYMM